MRGAWLMPGGSAPAAAPTPPPRTPLPECADVVVAGASFAGLAAARALGPRALVLDRAPLGAHQTSACALPVHLVERMDAGAAVLQRHDRLVITVDRRTTTWPLPRPFGTIDYAAFCRLAFAASGARFHLAAVTGVTRTPAPGGWLEVHTAAGTVRTRFVVDAMGPRSPLARALPGRRTAFGVETELPAPMDDGLRFAFLPEVRDGYAWAFPSGPVTRFGVLSYRGRTKLLPALRAFLARFGLTPGPLHGGFLATGLRPLPRAGVFPAGDAGGHCLPLTGEGIRTALLAGTVCGGLLAAALEGRISAAAAADAYTRFLRRSAARFRWLTWLTAGTLLLPRPVLGWTAAAMARPAWLARFYARYFDVFSDDPGAGREVEGPDREGIGSTAAQEPRGVVPGEGVEPSRGVSPSRF